MKLYFSILILEIFSFVVTPGVVGEPRSTEEESNLWADFVCGISFGHHCPSHKKKWHSEKPKSKLREKIKYDCESGFRSTVEVWFYEPNVGYTLTETVLEDVEDTIDIDVALPEMRLKETDADVWIIHDICDGIIDGVYQVQNKETGRFLSPQPPSDRRAGDFRATRDTGGFVRISPARNGKYYIEQDGLELMDIHDEIKVLQFNHSNPMEFELRGYCKAEKVSGFWNFLMVLPYEMEFTFEVGTTRGGEEQYSETWAQSVTAEAKMGFDTGTINGETHMSGTVANEMTKMSQAFWEQEAVEEQVITFDPKYKGRALWRYEVSIEDSCNFGGETKTRHFAFTESAAMPPCCLPGFASDVMFPYRKCIDEQYRVASNQCKAYFKAKARNVKRIRAIKKQREHDKTSTTLIPRPEHSTETTTTTEMVSDFTEEDSTDDSLDLVESNKVPTTEPIDFIEEVVKEVEQVTLDPKPIDEKDIVTMTKIYIIELETVSSFEALRPHIMQAFRNAFNLDEIHVPDTNIEIEEFSSTEAYILIRLLVHSDVADYWRQYLHEPSCLQRLNDDLIEHRAELSTDAPPVIV